VSGLYQLAVAGHAAVVRALPLAAEGEGPALESHHPWWPELKEIIWGGLAIVVVFGLIAKLATPAIKKSLAARTERIADEINAAEKAKAAATADLQAARASVAGASDEATRIVEQARVDADRMIVELRSRLEDEIQALRAQASADIEVARNRAATDVQLSIGSVAQQAAERIVLESLDDGAKTDLVERFIASVGASGKVS
jgi:F-type H+-transporting ATPase subunit b